VSRHPHESVKLVYFDTVARYSRLLIKMPQFIVPVLGSFVDDRGMRSSNQIIKSRTTFLFLKIVKALQNNLHPFVEDLYKYLKEFLTIDISQIEAVMRTKSPSKSHQQVQLQDDDKRLDDKLFLYEAMGNILSSDKVSNTIRTQVLEQILQPILNQMDNIVSNKLYLRDTNELPIFATLLAHQISSIAYLSKGFGKSGNHLQESRQVFKNVLVHNIVAVSKEMPNNQIVAEKVIMYLHRMIALLGDNDVLELFPIIVSQLFHAVQNNEYIQLRDIVILINQLITKYGQKCAALVNELLMPLVGKLFQMIDQGNYDQNIPSEETRQKMELHKTYFLFINTIICNNLGKVLTSPQNISHLNQILETLVQGCGHASPHLARLCFTTLNHVIKRYCNATQITEFNQLPNFSKYVHERIVSTCFSVPLQQGFDLGDGINNQILMEIVQLLRDLVRGKNSQEFILFLSQTLLPQLKLSTQDIQILIGHLQTADEKTMKRVLKEFFKTLQQR
jgi:exportin-T